jgi:hypothetical protein
MAFWTKQSREHDALVDPLPLTVPETWLRPVGWPGLGFCLTGVGQAPGQLRRHRRDAPRPHRHAGPPPAAPDAAPPADRGLIPLTTRRSEGCSPTRLGGPDRPATAARMHSVLSGPPVDSVSVLSQSRPASPIEGLTPSAGRCPVRDRARVVRLRAGPCLIRAPVAAVWSLGRMPVASRSKPDPPPSGCSSRRARPWSRGRASRSSDRGGAPRGPSARDRGTCS